MVAVVLDTQGYTSQTSDRQSAGITPARSAPLIMPRWAGLALST